MVWPPRSLPWLLCLFDRALAAPVRAAYVNELGSWVSPEAIAASLGVPGYAPANQYNVFIMSFWLPSGPTDAAEVWAHPTKYLGENPWGTTDGDIQKAWAKEFERSRKRVLVSLFGATSSPTSEGLDAAEVCRTAGRFATDNHFHGVDIDWEDTAAMDSGGEAWLVECTRAVRAEMPSGVLTHAPQAPYFSTALFPAASYRGVHLEVGHAIDWYHVQFYNQEQCDYVTYGRLFGGNLSCIWGDSTVLDIVRHGVAAEKIVVTKPVARSDVEGSGLMASGDLAAAVLEACGWWSTGLAAWQYASDLSGEFIAESAVGCLSDAPPWSTATIVLTAVSSASLLMLCCVHMLASKFKNQRVCRALLRELEGAAGAPGSSAANTSCAARSSSLARRTSLASDPEFEEPDVLATWPSLRDETHDETDDETDPVCYSRLLAKDAEQWLDDASTTHLAFSPAKQMGFVKLLAVVTMYAETPKLLERTLRGLALCLQPRDGEGLQWSSEEAVVCIVADGLEKLPGDTARWLEDMGVYNPGLMEHTTAPGAGDPEVALHCFEGLLRFEGLCPLQVMLIVKQANAGKLDSQRWAFVGIAERLFPTLSAKRQPARQKRGLCGGARITTLDEMRSMDRYLVTVDAGTEPLPGSIPQLIRPMRHDLGLAATCGTMLPDLPGCRSRNLIVMSQVFEYEVGHILEKSLESMFGFISVLPGAFSAYRYDAVRRHQWTGLDYAKSGPLVEYFRALESSSTSPAFLNMGLAEDRLLCFKLVAMEGRNHSLRYCKGAKAVTDVPDTLDSLIRQRRRWNNGAFFSKLYALRHFRQVVCGTDHSAAARAAFLFQALLMVLELALGWFSIALFHLLCTFAIKDLPVLSLVVGSALNVCLLAQLIAYQDSKNQQLRKAHVLMSGICACCFFVSVEAFLAGQVWGERDLRTTLAAAVPLGSILVAALAHGRLPQVLAVAPAYLALLPTYVALIPLHASCHVHDVSWGTKGIDTVHITGSKEAATARLSHFRLGMVLLLVLSNAGFVLISRQLAYQHVLLPLMVMITLVYLVRLLGSIAYMISALMQSVLDQAFKLMAASSWGKPKGAAAEGAAPEVPAMLVAV